MFHEALPGLLIALSVVLGFFGVIFYLVFKSRQRHNASIKAYAESVGFDYVQDADNRFSDRILSYDLFDDHRSDRLGNRIYGQFYNLIHGRRNGFEISVFEHKYRQSKATTIRSIVTLSSPSLTLPDFVLMRQTWLHALGDIFDKRDINFPEYTKFSRNYYLRGKDIKSIRNIFNKSVIEFFDHNDAFQIEVKNNVLLCYQTYPQCNPEDIPALIKTCEELLALLTASR